jgi:hypothetical protein
MMGDGTKVNRSTFEELIAGNLEWLERVAGRASTLERQHIEMILRDAPRCYYEQEAALAAVTRERDELRLKLAAAEADRDKAAWDARRAEANALALRELVRRAVPSVQFATLLGLVDEMNMALATKPDIEALREFGLRVARATAAQSGRNPWHDHEHEAVVDAVLAGEGRR